MHAVLKAHTQPVQRIYVITDAVVLPVLFLLALDPLHYRHYALEQESVALVLKQTFHLTLDLFYLLWILQVLLALLADEAEVREDDVTNDNAHRADQQQHDEGPGIQDKYKRTIFLPQELAID